MLMAFLLPQWPFAISTSGLNRYTSRTPVSFSCLRQTALNYGNPGIIRLGILNHPLHLHRQTGKN